MKSEDLISPDDPRLSAYLLGELTAEESLIVEAQLRRSPDAVAELAALREMSDLLRSSFAVELEAQNQVAGPKLSVLPAPKADEKVVAFSTSDIPSPWSHPARIASVATLAAAVVVAAVMLPKAVTVSGTSPQMAAVPPAAVREVVKPAPEAPAKSVASVVPSGSKVPNFGYQGSDSPAGVRLASLNSGDSPESQFARPLGSDPTITEVRFLADDPIDLRSVPLPAELLSYLPEEDREPEMVRAAYHGEETATRRGIQHLYLDTEKYPDPDIVHNRVELAGGVFQVEGDRTRSLYRTEQRSDMVGRTSVILKGMVRLEAGEEVAPAADEPDPSYDFGVLSVSWNPAEDEEKVFSLPSGGTLRKADVSIGNEVSGGNDIAERFIVRQKEKSRRALELGANARQLLGNGDAAAAVTQLEVALQLLPDAPVTAGQRAELSRLLDEANAALKP
ncbi:MAG: hypothetical protein KDN19_22540 [Verrucomicrobiae bacterium]|nr:hypothetical protein [Verrucomicrobiae bacterium]